MAGPSLVRGVADRFVSRWAELEPTEGLIDGLAGTPGRLSDWSPEGRAQVAEALRRGLEELDRTPLGDEADRRAAAVMRDRLQTWLASAGAKDWAVQLDAGFSAPPAMDRIALSTAPLADADDAGLLASRLEGLPRGMRGYAAALRLGLDEGRWHRSWRPRYPPTLTCPCRLWKRSRMGPVNHGTQLAAASRDGHLALRRVERQQALIERLHAAHGERVQLEALATDLGVSMRTVARDVERLRLSGVPLTTHQGRGGGVSLPPTGAAIAVVLDLPEAAALMSSLTVLGPTVSQSAASAMRKLAEALQPTGSRPTVGA